MPSPKIDLPEDLMPDEDFVEMGKKNNEQYKKLYAAIKDGMESDEDTSAAAILILAEFTARRVAALIGEGLSDYDYGVLRGLIERHITSVVFKE